MQELHNLASGQHGFVSRRQLRELGIPPHQVRRWELAGRLQTIHPNVFALPGVPLTAHSTILAAVLETGRGACASHNTAAWLWGISGFESKPINVVVNRHSRHHERLDWQVHQFTGLPRHHRRYIDGIPVTSPALTMLHLAATVGEARLGRAIDNAWSLRILSGQDLFDLDRELAQRGRNGIVALRNAAQERGLDWVPPESNLESRFMSLVDPLGKRGFRRQVQVAGEGWSARVDFLHYETKTVFEIQSERYHSSLTDRAADARRISKLEALGYRVVEIWDNELFHRPDEVLRRVNQAIYRVA